jgi:AAA+ ATPase superfamily predicted ATPase
LGVKRSKKIQKDRKRHGKIPKDRERWKRYLKVRKPKNFLVQMYGCSKVLLGMPSHTWYGYPYLYFDVRPKNRKEDFYNREKELKQFSDALSYAPIIVISGMRRTGKTSFLNVALAESNEPHAVLDLRGLPYNPSNADIVRRLNVAFNGIDHRWFSKLSDAMKHLRGVEILGNEISFGWGEEGVDLPELFSEINVWAGKEKKQFLMAFDEIQLIRGDKWIPRFFAHVADSYRNIILILTGSECGLMFDFLGFDDPNAPLFGRSYVQIQMENFSAQQAEDFLIKGFQQMGLAASSQVVNYAVQNLDGSAGWLTLFGSRCQHKHSSTEAIVDEVVSEAGMIAREEALKLTVISKRYGAVLNYLAGVGQASWRQIKTVTEANEGHALTHSAISKVLNNLVKTAFLYKVDEKYSIADPLMAKGIKEEELPQ